jgi:hypothetical protein
MTTQPASYPRHRFPAEIISHAVGMSLRNSPAGIAKLMSGGSSSAYHGRCAALRRHTGASLLFPDLEGRSASTTISIGRHQMPTRAEVTIDYAVRREEPLRLGRGLEPLHLPLSPSRRPMRILRTVIQISALM